MPQQACCLMLVGNKYICWHCCLTCITNSLCYYALHRIVRSHCATLSDNIAYQHHNLCLHAAWRAWTKEFQESESYWQHHDSAENHSTDNADIGQQEKSTWSNIWQHFGSSQHSNPWQDYFTSTGKGRSSSSQKQHRQDAGRKVYQAQQQHCMQILGLAPTVSLDASIIRTAFLECAKRWHPDRHSDDAKLDAESKFKDAQTAYQHLLTCL